MASRREMALRTQADFELRMLIRKYERDEAKTSGKANSYWKKAKDLLAKGKAEEARGMLSMHLEQKRTADQFGSLAQETEGILNKIKLQQSYAEANETMTKALLTIGRVSNPEKDLQNVESLRNKLAEQAISRSIYDDALAYNADQSVAPDEKVQEMLATIADELGMELDQELAGAHTSKIESSKESEQTLAEPSPEAEDALRERLKALRVDE